MNQTSITPEHIKQLCQQIDELLASPDFDTEQLNLLLAERDSAINLQLAQLQGDALREFSQQQLDYNQHILAVVKGEFGQIESQLGNFMKARKAIKKYKKS